MSNARILVVDDDQVIQQLLKVNLELEGYAVEVASDGEEALVLFDRFRPDLVLLDIMMPKLDGWEVARRLAGTTGGPVPIVLLSARAQESDVQKGNDLGVAAYVTKPFDPIQLLHLVAGIIAQQDRGAATPGALALDPADTPEPALERPRLPGHGDWAPNVAMVLAKAAKAPPRAVAEAIVAHLEPPDWVAGVEVAGPGFVNVRLDQTWFAALVRRVLAAGESFGTIDL